MRDIRVRDMQTRSAALRVMSQLFGVKFGRASGCVLSTRLGCELAQSILSLGESPVPKFLVRQFLEEPFSDTVLLLSR